ncbi:hypothetical protein [Occultella glacieicola]|nr:hypothetical protein [Occultella glacieicola]
MLRAAAELQRRLPALRTITDRHIRSILREFFLAGWTVGDVILAIDQRPNNAHWHHDGATGVGNTGAWLTHRLRPWRTTDGVVRVSPSQRAAATHAENRARQAARRQAEANDRALRHADGRHDQARDRVKAWWDAFRTGRTNARSPEEYLDAEQQTEGCGDAQQN